MQTAKRSVLIQPMRELLVIQNQLNEQSSYYGALLQTRLGTDTLPFLVMTAEGELLLIDNMYCFRIEAISEQHVLVLLLQSYSAEHVPTSSLRELCYVTKTERRAKIPLQQIAAIQLLNVPLQQSIIAEKW